MPAMWVSLGSAALGAMSSGDGGGGTQTQSKEPWAPAVPWITSNLQAGQSLQDYYQKTPFNALQQSGYANLLGANDYVNSMVPGLLSQFSQNTGFDRNNPRARPQAYQFPTMGSFHAMRPLLGDSAPGGMNQAQNPYRNGLLASTPAAPAASAGPAGYDLSTQQGMLDWARSIGGAGSY